MTFGLARYAARKDPSVGNGGVKVRVPPPTPFQGLRTLGNTGDPPSGPEADRSLVIDLSSVVGLGRDDPIGRP